MKTKANKKLDTTEIQELATKVLKWHPDDSIHNPNKNIRAISIVLQDDGNYIGLTQKNGKLIRERAGDPHTVLELLITHE